VRVCHPEKTEETVVKMEMTSRHNVGKFDDIYRRYLRPVYAFVSYRLDARADAEDVTAVVFEKAWRAFPRFDPGKAEASTWLFAIARNCLNDHFRSLGRKAKSVELDDDIQSDGGDDPEPRLQALEVRRELVVAIMSLDEREREIVALKFGGHMNNREIGRLLDISESNVGTILYRSLNKLKNQLEGGIEND
jgi:RNA polymerase sigma-70 factor (ECF subfamily)